MTTTPKARVKRRLSAAEFDTVRPLMKISDDRITAARAHLVDGLTMQAVGEQHGCSRQAVNDSVNTFWRAVENYRESQKAAAHAAGELPEGWEQVTLVAPSHLIEKFRYEIAQAAPKPEKKKQHAGQ